MIQEDAGLGSSVPYERKRFPVAQFCATDNVLSKNGTEPVQRDEIAGQRIEPEKAPPFGVSVPYERKGLPVAQICAINGILSKNGTET